MAIGHIFKSFISDRTNCYILILLDHEAWFLQPSTTPKFQHNWPGADSPTTRNIQNYCSYCKRSQWFCADARPCFERLKSQLDLRFDSKQRNCHNIVRDDQDMVLAMMCDPRVKHHMTSGHQLVSLRIVPNTVSLPLAVASQLLAIKEAHLPFYSALAQKHHTISGAAVDLLGTDENDFESLEDISDGEIEADEDVSTSITDQRK